jgi:deoxyribonuclease V
VNSRALHEWDVGPAEAQAIQRRLAPLVVRTGTPEHVRFIAGTDISVGGRESGGGLAAVVVLRWPGLEPVEQVVVRAEVRFPYVPGLLSFRELPLLLPCFERLSTRPDLVIVDGQGIAHPRRFGIAAHLGLLLDLPTIGCAKSRLTGHPAGELAAEKGARVSLMDKGEVVGCALRTRAGTNPVFVSPGHRVGLAEAADWVLACTSRYRLPEPTRLAHQAAAGMQVAPTLESDEGNST